MSCLFTPLALAVFLFVSRFVYRPTKTYLFIVPKNCLHPKTTTTFIYEDEICHGDQAMLRAVNVPYCKYMLDTEVA